VANITNIPSARSDFLDPRAPGKVSREWYQFLLNLFTLLGAGSNTASLSDLLVSPPAQDVDETDQHTQLAMLTSRYDVLISAIEQAYVYPPVQVGTLGEQQAAAARITGGTIDGTTVGATTAATVKGSTVQASTAAGFISSDNSTGITANVTTATLVGKTLTFKDGICTGFV
jgi:hypothetical protein